jgi:hypothetical protein
MERIERRAAECGAHLLIHHEPATAATRVASSRP